MSLYHTSPSTADLILATLNSARNTRRFKNLLSEKNFKNKSPENIRVSLYRLRKRAYVSNSPNGWTITTKGKNYAQRTRLLDYFPSPFTKDSPTNTIISFDIPVHSRTIRNWLRNQIKIFGYKILQQSLWIGPGPLPQAFMKRLEDLKIRNNVKTFRIKN